MTILMFRQYDDGFQIITDTLATYPDKSPLMFQTKCWAIPHINMAMAVTGVANLGAEWNRFICESAVVRHVDELDNFASQELQRIWGDMDTENLAGTTATIYHFGFEDQSMRTVRYIYRSEKGFESERSNESCSAVKPHPQWTEWDTMDDIEGCIELASRLRVQEDSLSDGTGVAIGGQLFMTLLGPFSSRTELIHEFPDYRDTWNAMCERLNES